MYSICIGNVKVDVECDCVLKKGPGPSNNQTSMLSPLPLITLHLSVGIINYSLRDPGGKDKEGWGAHTHTHTHSHTHTHTHSVQWLTHILNPSISSSLQHTHTHTHWRSTVLSEECVPGEGHQDRQSPSSYLWSLLTCWTQERTFYMFRLKRY